MNKSHQIIRFFVLIRGKTDELRPLFFPVNIDHFQQGLLHVHRLLCVFHVEQNLKMKDVIESKKGWNF